MNETAGTNAITADNLTDDQKVAILRQQQDVNVGAELIGISIDEARRLMSGQKRCISCEQK